MNVFSQKISDAVTLGKADILINTKALEVWGSRRKWNLKYI